MSKVIFINQSFDIDNFHSDSNRCYNISKLYDFINEDISDTNEINEINEILKNVTDEEIMINGKAQHPFLHELCHQVAGSFELLKIIWNSIVFKNYWENKKYCDKYGNTALQRLSLNLDYLEIEKLEWIKENMLVVSREIN